MTLISWNGTGPILKNGAIGTEAGCCCGCDVDQTFSWGSEVSGAIVYSIVFPSAEHCVKVVITVTSAFAPEILIRSLTFGVFGDFTTLYGWSGEGSVTLCLKKDDGRDRIQINLRNNDGTSGTIRVTCDTCDCNEFP
jgi:hypothetical protein